LALPLRFRENPPIGTDVLAGEISNLPMEANMGQIDADWDAESLRNPVPAVHGSLNFAGLIVAQPRIERGQSRYLPIHYLSIFNFLHRVEVARERVIVTDLGFLVAAF